MTLSIKNSDVWNSTNTLYAEHPAYSNLWFPSKEAYVKDAGTWKPFYRTQGPQLRVLGGTFATNSATVPATLPITIPATAQIGDYLVVANTNNAGFTEGLVGGTAWVSHTGVFNCGTYCEGAVIHVKICTAQDIGRTYNLNAGGFPIQALVYVFTNPNKYGTTYSYAVPPFGVYDNDSQSNPGNTSSVTVPFSSQLPPKHVYECRLFAFAANGSSTYPNQTYSGPGSFRALTDAYWWRSIGMAYIVNNTGSASSVCSVSNPSALSWVGVRLP